MHVAIAHNAISADARADEQDVLVQVETVREGLSRLGHSWEVVPIGEEWGPVRERWTARRPDVVFNLIESFAGSDRLASLAVALVEELGLPITGSSASTLWVTNHKTLAKERLRAAQLPTPGWYEDASAAWHRDSATSPRASTVFRASLAQVPWTPGDRFLLKPVGEHASLGLDETAIVGPDSLADLQTRLRSQSERLGRPCFAEQFIVGREFNVSLLACEGGCEVLPLAEIDFSQFPAGKPRIVDYRAKWEPQSFEFQNTPRRFLEPHEDSELASELRDLARACWDLFDLRGYVRVDFRVDEAGRPWILEINTNPCLSPDAGYFAALRAASCELPTAIQRVLEDAVRSPAASVPRVAAPPARPADPDLRSSSNQNSSTSVASGVEAEAVVWRYEVRPSDQQAIRDLVARTGFFYPDEVDIAVELVTDRLRLGDASGYHFVIAEQAGEVVGYASYGHIACTRNSYDLYWIAVDPRQQGKGLGRMILAEAELQIQTRGGQRVYIETSNREQYQSTRGFYLRCGYHCEATLAEFYGPGDDKVVYVKALGQLEP